MKPPRRSPNAGAAARKAIAYPVLNRWPKTKGEMDQDHRRALRKAGQALVSNCRCFVVSQRRPTTSAHRRGAYPSGRRRDDCFFSLDLTLTATQILEIFSRRWPLEVCFRDVKPFLGFEDPQNRVAQATTHLRSGPARVRAVRASTGRQVRPWTVCGIHKKLPFPSRTFFGRYVTRLGRRGFSATPLWMHTPEKSSNPLWNRRRDWHKSAKL
jgi:hypothetical protein